MANLGSSSTRALHRQFLTLLPRIELHGRVYFRHLRCEQTRQDAIAEIVALAWKWFLRLGRRGKAPNDFPSAIATFAARAVNNGRRLCGMDRPNDVLSPRARHDRRFTASPLPLSSSLDGSLFEEALHDNTQTPVPEQVAFRLDFPSWLLTHTERDRRLVTDLMRRERTQEIGRRYGLSAGRVSQLRREFHADWRRFTGEAIGCKKEVRA
jgi:hypothetical protein